MLSTIAEMDRDDRRHAAFARDEAESNRVGHGSSTALVQSIVDDMADAGLAVDDGACARRAGMRPDALKRA